MISRLIKTEPDYEKALTLIEVLMDAEPGTAEMDESELLTTLVEIYENQLFPFGLPNTWIDESMTKIDYEIYFTKYFNEFKPLRSLAEIKADILALEITSLALEKAVLEE